MMLRLLAPIVPLLASLLAAVVGYGVQYTLVPVQAASRGFSDLGLGLLGSAYFTGLVLGCIMVPPLIRAAGHARAFAVLTALVAAITLLHPLIVAVLPWLFFRFLIGCCVTGFYLIVESWLNTQTGNRTRGLFLSVYTATTYSGMTLAQLLASTNTEGFTLFAVSALLVALSPIPLLLSLQPAPTGIPPVRFRPRRLFRISPIGFTAIALSGFAQASVWALAPVFALAKGLGPSNAGLFLASAICGGALAQVPIGHLADRFDRLLVLAATSIASAVIGLWLTLLPAPGLTIYLLGALLGAAIIPPYAVAAAYIYDRVPAEEYVETSAGVLMVYSASGIVGPFVAGLTMQLFGGHTAFLAAACAMAVLAVYLLAGRLTAREERPPPASGAPASEGIALPDGEPR